MSNGMGYRQQSWQGYAQNPLSLLLGSIGAAREQGIMRQRMAALAELGAQRLESIGIPEAQQLAQIYRQSPVDFLAFADQLGGIEKIDDALRTRAQQQLAAQTSQEYFAGLGEEEPSGLDLYRKQIEAGVLHQYAKEPSEAVSSLRGQEPERKMIQQDGIWYWVDTGDKVLPITDPIEMQQVPPEKRFESESVARKEYTALSKEFLSRRSSVAQIVELADLANRSPIAQRGLIFSIMKMFDPTSVVRESEQATAENARGVPASIRNYWNKVLLGQVLTPDQIVDIQETAKQSLMGAVKVQKDLEKQFLRIAEISGLRPQMAVPDYIGEWRKMNVVPTQADIGEYQRRLNTDDPVRILKAMEKDGFLID